MNLAETNGGGTVKKAVPNQEVKSGSASKSDNKKKEVFLYRSFVILISIVYW